MDQGMQNCLASAAQTKTLKRRFSAINRTDAKKASAQHIISPMYTLDFKIPVDKLLKNPPPFVSQHLHPPFINQNLLCAS